MQPRFGLELLESGVLLGSGCTSQRPYALTGHRTHRLRRGTSGTGALSRCMSRLARPRLGFDRPFSTVHHVWGNGPCTDDHAPKSWDGAAAFNRSVLGRPSVGIRLSKRNRGKTNRSMKQQIGIKLDILRAASTNRWRAPRRQPPRAQPPTRHSRPNDRRLPKAQEYTGEL
jgi:hypothetical protein